MNPMSIASAGGSYCLLRLDQPVTMMRKLGLDPEVEANFQVVRDLTKLLLETLSPHVTGVVLDNQVGLSLITAKAQESGALLRLNQEETPVMGLTPSFASDWGVEHVANNYAAAFLEMSYSPEEERALEKKQLVAELADFCRYTHTVLIVSLDVSFNEPGENETTGEDTTKGKSQPAAEATTPHQLSTALNDLDEHQALATLSSAAVLTDQPTLLARLLQTAEEFRGQMQVVAVPYPEDILTMATLTAELDIPWLVKPHPDIKYDHLKDQVRAGVENGAKGFLIDDQLWTEAYQVRRPDQGIDLEAWQRLVTTTVRDRILELRRIVLEAESFD